MLQTIVLHIYCNSPWNVIITNVGVVFTLFRVGIFFAGVVPRALTVEWRRMKLTRRDSNRGPELAKLWARRIEELGPSEQLVAGSDFTPGKNLSRRSSSWAQWPREIGCHCRCRRSPVRSPPFGRHELGTFGCQDPKLWKPYSKHFEIEVIPFMNYNQKVTQTSFLFGCLT